MSVKEVFIENGVIVGQCFSETGQTGCRDLLESGFVRFVTNPPHIEDYAVLCIHIAHIHGAGGEQLCTGNTD